MAAGRKVPRGNPEALGPQAVALAEAVKQLGRPAHFEAGDFVDWKPGLQNRSVAGPFPVVERLAQPIVDHTADVMSPSYREPLDTIVLYGMQPTRIDNGQSVPSGPVVYMQMFVDSRRLERART